MIERTFRKSYTVPNTKLTIGEGKTLIVPVLAIQRDEKYFVEPLKYKPLRFLHDKPEESEQCKTAFVGFGIGGAQCTGKKFEKFQRERELKISHSTFCSTKLCQNGD